MTDETYNELTPEEERVILHKGTEMPFSGKYDEFFENGAYLCRRCDAPLYRSDDKFNSHCGWPSFDDEIEGAVHHQPDGDGMSSKVNVLRRRAFDTASTRCR
jgi:peptide methionine sulfoxide reductase MsrB